MTRVYMPRPSYIVTAGYWNNDGGCVTSPVGTYPSERAAFSAAMQAALLSAWVNVDRRVPTSATGYREEPVAVFTKDESGKVVRDVVEEV